MSVRSPIPMFPPPTLRDPSGIRIRAMRPGDLPQVLEIERSSFSTPWSDEAFRSLLGRGVWELRVAEDPAGGICGYVVLASVVDQGEIGNLAVAPAARGRGIGRMLLDDVEARARDRRVHHLFLEVRESNAAARALYAGAGFVVAGLRRGYYERPTEDALVLVKELTPQQIDG